MTKTVLYHATFAANTKSIENHGLLTGKRRNWDNQFGVKQGKRGYIYLSTSFQEAARWASKMEWDFQKPVAVVKVRTDVPFENDTHWQSAAHRGSWVMCKGSVPAADIEKVFEVTHEMKRAIVQNTLVDPTEPAAPQLAFNNGEEAPEENTAPTL